MWENCLRVDSHNALAHGGVADNLASAGHFDEAIGHYRIAVSRDPDNSDTLRNFALLLASCPQKQFRNYAMAEVLAERACRVMEPPDPACVMALAEVYAQTGRSELAVATTKKAIQVAQAAGNPALAGELRRRLKRYQDQDGP
jgi:Tfp pilus assembly protein PilF